MPYTPTAATSSVSTMDAEAGLKTRGHDRQTRGHNDRRNGDHDAREGGRRAITS